MNPLARLAGAVLAALFAYAAALQYNDPDPAPWIAIYAAAAVVSVLFAAGRNPSVLAALVAMVAAAWSATLVGDAAEAQFSVDDEEVRELGGLTIIAAACALIALRSFVVRRRAQP